MPFSNLISDHYTTEEKALVNKALASLEETLSSKLVNLSPEDRQKYGSVGEQNKLIVNKVRDYRINQPELSSDDVDWEEFLKDFESREFLQATIAKLENFVTKLNNNKILHDFDNYQASLTDYGFSQYKRGTNKPGFETKVNELAQFFSRTGTTTKTSTPTTPEVPPAPVA
jgi:activator of HSP90 ATPase